MSDSREEVRDKSFKEDNIKTVVAVPVEEKTETKATPSASPSMLIMQEAPVN